MYNKIQHFFTAVQRRLQPEKRLLAKIPGARPLARFVDQYRLFFAILFAIIIALVLTAVSIFLYIVTGTSKLDLSRPGYEGAREKVRQAETNEKTFGPSGPIDEDTLKSFLDEYKKQAQRLNGYDTFNPKILEDNQLGLDSTTQIAPSDGAN